MSERIYPVKNKLIKFSEDNPIGCLCTFPHNDTNEKGEVHIDLVRLQELACLGCAYLLELYENEEITYSDDNYILIPESIEKYYRAIKECIMKNLKE